MPNSVFKDNSPHNYHFITEPLNSFTPEKLDNGDLRMAIACAGQHAYNVWGEEATLTEDFLSRDYRTWEGGLVSINHEPNQDWVKAKIYDLEYDSKKKLVICSFSGIPEWVKSLIYSEDYRGLSQECIPIEMKSGSMDVVKGYGTGVTIVTDPYNPAASPEMGVGVRPELAAILASKYPSKIEDNSMAETKGGGQPAVSVEAFESTVSENVTLKSQIKALETDIKKVTDELASWKQKFDEQKSGENDRLEAALKARDEFIRSEVKREAEREAAINDFKSMYSEDFVKMYLSQNPSTELLVIMTKNKKVESAKDAGTPQSSQPEEDGESYESIKRRFNAKLGRA